MKPGLLTPSLGYKPHRYEWAHEFWQRQQRVHWLPEEAPLGEDCKDWAVNLSGGERNLLTQIFRFFTQSDIEVNDCYMTKYAGVFKPTEVKMMLAAFANTETIHIEAYSLLVETVGMPESEYSAFMDYEAMRAKHDYLQTFGMKSHRDILLTTAAFGGATEGVSLWASFAMLMNFPRLNKMKGMGQIVSWSIRDESLHCEGIIKLHHAFAAETGARTRGVEDEIVDVFKATVAMEDKFIDLAFEAGEVQGMTPEDIKAYIRFIADWRLRQLKLPEAFGGRRDNPLPWLQSMLSAQEHANFFEARSTEYSKAASRGKWHGAEGVWAAFDQVQTDRTANAAA
jgi:ribonucleoside-diphosphate reductase beta chain